MKLLLAALVATFTIAVVAAVFAIWPAVADAPWEDETVVQPTPVQAQGCDILWEQFTQARTNAIAGDIKSEMQRSRCPQVPLSQSEPRPIQPIQPIQPIR